MTDSQAAKKITLSLSEKSYGDMQDIVTKSGSSISNIIRFALSLAKLYFDETKNGHVLFIGDKNGKPITRVMFP